MPEKRGAKWRSDHANVQSEFIKSNLKDMAPKSIAAYLGIAAMDVSTILKVFKAFVSRKAF